MNHLNAFGGTGRLPTYHDRSLVKDETVRRSAQMVRFLHRQGAV